MDLNRRDFLGIIGGGTAGLGLSKLPIRRLVGLDDVAVHTSVKGVESWVRTSCQICPGGCGMEVRMVDGRPVGVRGNQLHPVNRGGLCPVGAESLHLLYHPDRYKAPLQRASSNPTEEGWKGVDWEDALGAVASRIEQLRAAGEADRIVVLDGYGRGLLSSLARTFVREVGSNSYFVDHRPDPMPAAMKLAQGHAGAPAYDLENAQTILSFGTPLLEGWQSPMQGHRAVGGVRRSNVDGDRRALIQIDTRYSKTAQRADQFVRVLPGAQGAVALAVAYVLISQELYDRDYIEQHTSGFEDWTDEDGVHHEGFRSFALRACRPQDLEPITGVKPREILEIARRFGESRPSVAVTDGSALSYSNGVSAARAIQALNALVGAIERPGGVVLSDAVPALMPGEDSTGNGVAELSVGNDVEALLSSVRSSGTKPGLIFLLHSDPFFSSPRGERLRDLIGPDTTVVSFTPLKDESSRYADYILPDSTFFERWQDCAGPSTFPNAVLGITRPVTEPLYDTRDCGEVLLDLLHRSVPESSEKAPWTTSEELLKAGTKLLFAEKRGSAFTNEREAMEIREMELRGWWIPSQQSFDAFWQELLATGGWWDPAYPFELWGRSFRTPDNRFHFVAEAGSNGAAGEPAGLPGFEPVAWRGESGEGVLALQLFLPTLPNTGVAANFPWVREAVNPNVAWETWAELHHEDAESLGIHSGDMVEISADGASFLARAQITEEVQPGIVAVPYGLGRVAGGPWASQRTSHTNAVVVPAAGPASGGAERQSTRVHVRRRVENA